MVALAVRRANAATLETAADVDAREIAVAHTATPAITTRMTETNPKRLPPSRAHGPSIDTHPSSNLGRFALFFLARGARPMSPPITPEASAKFELLAAIRGSSEAEIIKRLETLTKSQLREIYHDMAPKDGDFERYHLPWLALVRLCELLYPSPKKKSRKSKVISQEDRAVVLAKRDERKQPLWNLADDIYESATSVINENLDQIAHTLSDWKSGGEETAEDMPDAPELNGDVSRGKLHFRLDPHARDTRTRKKAA
jgi:hypothetical protein